MPAKQRISAFVSIVFFFSAKAIEFFVECHKKMTKDRHLVENKEMAFPNIRI